jgi:hypothetical protein
MAITKTEKKRRSKADIDEEVDKQLFALLKKNPQLLESLPAGAQASLIASRLPKAQPVDQKFEQRLLSLSSLLSSLPDSRHMQLAVLENENQKLRAKLSAERAISQSMACRAHDTRRSANEKLEELRARLSQCSLEWGKWGAARRVIRDHAPMTGAEYDELAAELSR